jgi:hypothetical protein
MSYRPELDKPVPDALRAVAVERLERAPRRLREERDDDPVEAVHGARENLKKTLALLRLARPDLPSKTYRRENRTLRDPGCKISAGRDADVMVETAPGSWRALRCAPSEAPIRRAAPRAGGRSGAQRAHRRRHRQARRLAGGGGPPVWTRAARLLRRRHAALRGGRTYRAGRKAFAAARHPTDERLHEWRKRVKDLWYHRGISRSPTASSGCLTGLSLMLLWPEPGAWPPL